VLEPADLDSMVVLKVKDSELKVTKCTTQFNMFFC
jgi:hypothetical protein